MPRWRQYSIESLAGLRPLPLTALTSLLLASKNRQKTSPPMPVHDGSVTLRAAAVATAASAALPPSARISSPAWVASGWLEATMPLVP